MKQKLYLVKREVVATSLKSALTRPGHVYEIVLADEKNWPEQKKKNKLGFSKKK